MRKRSKSGFTLVEAIASFFVVSVVLTTSILLVVNVRNQAEATRLQIDAVAVGSLIRDDVSFDATYDAVSAWMAGAGKTLTSDTCGDPGSPYACSLFARTSGDIVYDTEVAIVFAAPTSDSLSYRVIRFTVVITYYGTRTVELEGMIYDV